MDYVYAWLVHSSTIGMRGPHTCCCSAPLKRLPPFCPLLCQATEDFMSIKDWAAGPPPPLLPLLLSGHRGLHGPPV